MQRLKGFVGDLSTGRGRLKLLILVLGVLIVLGAVTAGAINATSQPRFCSTCHEMQPEYVTWQASSHKDVSCIQCHVEPGLGPLVKDKLNAMVQVYEHLTGTQPNPIVLPPGKLPNENCERCHELGEIKPRGEIIIPHDRHVENGVSCVSCHAGIAHGKIAGRGVTTNTDYESWTAATGQQEMQAKNVRPDMQTCTSCHTERKVTNDCSACHANAKALAPASHREAGWGSGHGVTAREGGAAACQQCHTAQVEVKLASGDPAAALARGSQFCNQCHQKRPASHNDQWMLAHKEGVAAKGLPNCFTCHNTAENKEIPAPATTFCNRCHTFPSN